MPTFGHPMRDRWLLDRNVIYLNHGTVGAPPRAVIAAQRRIADEIERRPSQFLLRELAQIGVGRQPPAISRLRAAAARVASFVGAQPDDVAFVDNATTGINAILRSFPFDEGDEIVVTDLGLRRDPPRGRVRRPHPGADAEDRVPARPRRRIRPRSWPPSPMAWGPGRGWRWSTTSPRRPRWCSPSPRSPRCAGPGASACWWTAPTPPDPSTWICRSSARTSTSPTCNKWAWAPRSCGILWCRPELQPDLHPTVISWGHGQGLAAEFDWVGTRDPSPYLAAPAALDEMAALGPAAVMAYNRDLAHRGGRLLADAWGTALVGPASMIASMATVPLPVALGMDRDGRCADPRCAAVRPRPSRSTSA